MVKWACFRELIPADSYHKLECVEGLRKGKGRNLEPVKPVSVPDILATLPFLPEQVRSMVQVQYLCGMRPGEVCGMRSAWVDATSPVWLYKPQEHKNAHRDQLLIKAIPRQAQTLIQPLLHQKWIFPSQQGTAYRRDSYRNAFKRACQRAIKAKVQIEPWTPGQLRHRFIK